MRILYEDAALVVCVKPVGVECEHELSALLAEASGGTAQDYFCVHRLDLAVGGVMVYARTAKSAAALSQQVQQRTFKKEYLAVCSGAIVPAEGEMRDFLYKDTLKGRAYPVKSARRGVKEAVLHYVTLAVAPFEEATVSLVHIRLQTGRFHQIRCQFAARQHPLLGDGKYGSRVSGCTVALWSARLTFRHPVSGASMCFSAPPNAQFPWSAFDPTYFTSFHLHKE